MKKPFINKIIYLLLVSFVMLSFSGCNNNSPADDASQNEDTPNEAADDALNNAIDNALNNTPENVAPNNQPADNNNQAPETPSVNPTPLGEKSPMAIERIEPQLPLDNSSSSTPATDFSPNPADANPDASPTPAPSPVPNIFPVDQCQVEVNGVFDFALADSILAAINTVRAEYNLDALVENTSLHKCADARAKEQSFIAGHFRPNGRSWKTIAPEYVEGECIGIDYRSADDVIEAWTAVNKSRLQLLDPDYTQIGVAVYDINGIYYIAAEFAY